MKTDRAHPKAPLVATGLLRLFLPAAHRDGILGDLEETFVARARSGRKLAARCWFWGQAIRMSAGFARERWNPESAPPAVEPHFRGRMMFNWMSDRMSNWMSRGPRVRRGRSEK